MPKSKGNGAADHDTYCGGGDSSYNFSHSFEQYIPEDTLLNENSEPDKPR